MKTKIFITFLSFLSFASSSFANTNFETVPDTVKPAEHSVDRSSKHELCLGYSNPLSFLSSALYWDYFYNGNYNLPYYPFLSATNTFNAPTYELSYKYHSSTKMALRIGLDFNTSTTTFKQTSSSSSSPPFATETNGVTQFGTSIGMEMTKGEGKTQWFAGGDVFYAHFNSKDTYTDTGTLDVYKEGSNAFGLSPLIGVKYYISKIISVSAESRLNIFYSSYTIDETTTDSNSYTSFYSYKGSGFNLKLNPIGHLSLNIHF